MPQSSLLVIKIKKYVKLRNQLPKRTKRVRLKRYLAYSLLNSANLSFLTVVTLRLVHTAAPRILLKSEFKTAFACMELEGTAYLFPNFIHFFENVPNYLGHLLFSVKRFYDLQYLRRFGVESPATGLSFHRTIV